MKANLKRKMVIARELAAAMQPIDLLGLNTHERWPHKPRHFTIDLTDAQKKRARRDAQLAKMQREAAAR